MKEAMTGTNIETFTLNIYTITIVPKKRKVILLNTKTLKVTKARCKSGEPFSSYIAIALCWARMKNECVPKIGERKTLKEMKSGDRFWLNYGVATYIAPMPKTSNTYVIEKGGNLTRIVDNNLSKFDMV